MKATKRARNQHNHVIFIQLLQTEIEPGAKRSIVAVRAILTHSGIFSKDISSSSRCMRAHTIKTMHGIKNIPQMI